MEVKRVTPREAAPLLEQEGYVYLDVRSEQEWQSGHVPGSRNIPIAFMVPGRGMAPNPDFVEVCRRAFATETRILVGCRSGARSLRAAQELLRAGFSDVLDMRGGLGGEGDPMGRVLVTGWAAEGLPVTRDCPLEHSYPALAKGA
jgi:rhodanese-related sulfurtransferase